MRYLQEWASDPDTDVPGWLASGAPIGVAAPFSCRGIFPKAADAGEAVEECELLGGFGEAPNYKSAEEAHEAVRAELEREEAEGYITGYPSRQDAEIAAGGPIVQNKLAAVEKKSSGKMRIIVDARRCGANALASAPERIELPGARDVVEGVTALQRSCGVGESVSLVVLDFADAFRTVRLLQEERRFTGFTHDGRWYLYDSLPMGTKGSPLAWCRVAAFFGRAAAATLGDDGDVFTYVDDPLIAVKGSAGDRGAHTLRVLLLWSILGANLAWAKGQAGSCVTWIGAHITCAEGSVGVALPLETTDRWARDVGAVRLAGRADARTVRVLAGRGAWAAGLVPELRPFLDCLWAALAGGSGGRVPLRRIDHALRWLEAFLRSIAPGGGLARIYLAHPGPPMGALTVVTDASPWGLGAVMYYGGKPLAYVSDTITKEDEKRFATRAGRCSDQALWECLAILVGVIAFTPLVGGGGGQPPRELRVRTDSAAAEGALRKLRSPDGRVNAVARELALWQAVGQLRISYEHLPGADNGCADALSRGSVPDDLADARRLPAPQRSGDFWMTVRRP